MASTDEAWPAALPLLAESLAPGLQSLSRPALEALITERFGEGVTPEDVEGLFGDIGHALSRAGQAVGQVAGKALPGIVQGAASGAMVGGPWGALAGAALGGVGSALSSQRPGSAAGVVGQLAGTASSLLGAAGSRTPVGGLAGALTGGAVSPVASGIGGSPALTQLFAALGNPQVQGALRRVMLGRGAAPSVPGSGPGGGALPVTQVLSMLSGLATRAGEDAEALGLVDAEATEAFVARLDDPDSPAQRHGLLLASLAPYPLDVGEDAGEGADEGVDEGSVYDEVSDDDYDAFDDWLLALAADDPSGSVL